MSKQDRIWREGDEKWTYTEGESVPRYMWSQISMGGVVTRLNSLEATIKQLRESLPPTGYYGVEQFRLDEDEPIPEQTDE